MNKELILELENQFCAVKNVRKAHVDLDDDGEVLAIGIFSDGTRNPKEIKRDVEETFRQLAGYRVNHTKISIIEQNFSKGIIPEDKRIRFLTAYQVQKTNGIIEGVVSLDYNNNIITGNIDAHNFEMELEYIIANATIAALAKIVEDYNFRIDNVREVNMGQVDIIVVTVTVVHKATGAGHMYVGSVVETKDLLSSVAKATLDALNRRIDHML